MRAWRSVGLAVLTLQMAGSARADMPGLPKWQPPPKNACAQFDHPDKVADAIRAAGTCGKAAGLYLNCEDRWFNNPEMEQAAIDICEDAFQARIPAARYERYELLREGCVEKFQAADMRILWSAVRNCRVRLARDWAKRYGRK